MSSKYYNFIPDAALVGSIVVALFLNKIAPVMTVLPFPVSLIGWVIIIAAFGLAVSILSGLRAQHSSTNAADTPSVLITNRLYSHSRNPYYLLCLCVTVGAALTIDSLAAFIAPVLYFLTIQLIIIPLEERTLQIKFGKEYERYKHRVRKWL